MRDRIDLFDSLFGRGHLVVPRALASAIEHECESVGAPKHEAVVTIGAPGNFATFVGDLRANLLNEFRSEDRLPERLKELDLVIIGIPGLEGVEARWQPIVVGHELAHYLQRFVPMQRPVAFDPGLDRQRLSEMKDRAPASPTGGTSQVRALEQVAARWLSELVCDAYAVARFGAGGVAALSEFLESIGARLMVSPTHPPGALRTELMLSWLGDSHSEVDDEILEPFRVDETQVTAPDWAVYFCDVFRALGPAIWAAVEDWVPKAPYAGRGRGPIVESVAQALDAGIPASARIGLHPPDLEAADVLNGCWLAYHRGSEKPLSRLSLKALDTLDFLGKWREAGGTTEAEEVGIEPDPAPGCLTEESIRSRLASEADTRLVITPCLPGAVNGASVDLRLGNKFIVFERSGTPAFDSLGRSQDPRSMQSTVERAWGDVFYLHPGQLVLAATLEYLCLPGDLTAQVVTRSSYGRLGLISATAVQVHPRFAGCLTLELLNLGEMPLVITPGERIAQLMLFSTTGVLEPPDPGDDKYRFPTGPEFSKIRRDKESDILRQMRANFDQQHDRGPGPL